MHSSWRISQGHILDEADRQSAAQRHPGKVRELIVIDAFIMTQLI